MTAPSKQKILLVEDDEGVRKMIERWLGTHGFEVVSRASPRALLDIARRERPDAVLLDAHFSDGLLGFDLCSQLKGDPTTRDIPVVMMSGKTEYLEYQREALERGAAGFLRKPFLMADLAAALDQALIVRSGPAGHRSEPPRPTVLCVEDDENYRELVSSALEPAGIRCEFAPALKRAWEMLRAKQPNLILLDAHLPDGSGLDFCRELRGKEHQTVILVLTAHRRVFNKGEWFEAGADQCFPKTFDIQKLRQLVQAQLRRKQWDSPISSQINDLAFDQPRRIVTYQNQFSRALSVKEWQLLGLLCAKPGAIVIRERIHSEILCFRGGTAADLALNTFIMNLRKKLPPKLAQAIKTVKGQGYHLTLAD